jgi:hypothetical protein
MPDKPYKSMDSRLDLKRRDFRKPGGAAGAGLVLGTPALWARDRAAGQQTERIKTNIDDVKDLPRTPPSRRP